MKGQRSTCTLYVYVLYIMCASATESRSTVYKDMAIRYGRLWLCLCHIRGRCVALALVSWQNVR